LLAALVLASVVSGSPRNKRLQLAGPDPLSGSIGVTIHRPKVNRALEFSTKVLAGGSLEQPAVEVFFVKLKDGNEPFDATDLIVSNYADKSHVYLLNAEPGRYVAVAAGLGTTDGPAIGVTVAGQVGGVPVTFGMTFGVTIRANSFFSMEMISDTEVTVVPQEMAFMGDYVVSMDTKMKKQGDEAQAHYYRLLLPGMAEKSNFARNLGGQSVYRADIESVAKDIATERGFWTKSRDKVFKGNPGWQTQAERQLTVLSEQGAPD
jgi:hypothetical protein